MAYPGVHNRAISNMHDYGDSNSGNAYDMSLKRTTKFKLPRLEKNEI